MLKGKTKTGFKFEIDERLLNDYELVELLAEAEENPLLVSKILTKLLGEQKKELIEHVREEDGIVPADKMMEELEDIFKSGEDVKKLLILADFINHDREALIADFAETYKIYDYKQMPAPYVAILAKQLSPNSRIKRSLVGINASDDYLLQTLIFDRLNMLLWIQSEDGSKGINKPVSLYEKLTAPAKRNENEGFESGEEFVKRRQVLLNSIKKGGQRID